jgi:hypothetical protein
VKNAGEDNTKNYWSNWENWDDISGKHSKAEVQNMAFPRTAHVFRKAPPQNVVSLKVQSLRNKHQGRWLQYDNNTRSKCWLTASLNGWWLRNAGPYGISYLLMCLLL